MNYTPLTQRPKTYFVDVDGVIFIQHWPNISESDTAIYKTVSFLADEFTSGHTIILTTARPEAFREVTERQLVKAGVLYHRLIMGLPTGQRVLVNDKKPEEDLPTAVAINLIRDRGIQ